jgi:hypothetical protein
MTEQESFPNALRRNGLRRRVGQPRGALTPDATSRTGLPGGPGAATLPSPSVVFASHGVNDALSHLSGMELTQRSVLEVVVRRLRSTLPPEKIGTGSSTCLSALSCPSGVCGGPGVVWRPGSPPPPLRGTSGDASDPGLSVGPG